MITEILIMFLSSFNHAWTLLSCLLNYFSLLRHLATIDAQLQPLELEWDSFFIRLMGRSETHILLMAPMKSGREVMLWSFLSCFISTEMSFFLGNFIIHLLVWQGALSWRKLVALWSFIQKSLSSRMTFYVYCSWSLLGAKITVSLFYHCHYSSPRSWCWWSASHWQLCTSTCNSWHGG